MDDAPQHRPRPLPLFLEMLRGETAGDADRLAASLAGLRRYQSAQRAARPSAMPVIARHGRAALHDFGGAGPAALFVPSLINPPHVLDISAERSLLRWLARQGVRPLLIDWGSPGPAERDMDVAGHVTDLLLPLIDAIGEPVDLVGYCMGGTMAMAAAALRPVRSLVLMATPWRFAGFPPKARIDLRNLWDSIAPMAELLGLMPMEALQAGFWQLDPARTIRKFEDFGRLPEGDARADAFIALEDWANDGAPLTAAAGRELLIGLFGTDASGRGAWTVGGRKMRPEEIGCPVLNIVSLTDRIVPAATAAPFGQRLDLDLGHVGMIVGGRARTALWQPLSDWLSHPHNR